MSSSVPASISAEKPSTKSFHSTGWWQFNQPRPYVALLAFAFDGQGRFPMQFRGPNVRSVKNRWSPPTGLHEVGVPMEAQLVNELQEECGLEVDMRYPVLYVASYDNILPGEGWHWVVQMLACRVKTLDTFINKEPDKHPEYKFTTVETLRQDCLSLNANFERAFMQYTPRLVEVRNLLLHG